MSLTDRSCKCIRRRIRQSVMSANLRSSFALPKVRSDRYQGTQAIRLEFREPSPRRAASRDICGALKDPFTNPINLVQVKYNLRSHQPGSKLTVIFDPSCINDAQSLPPNSFHSTTYLTTWKQASTNLANFLRLTTRHGTKTRTASAGEIHPRCRQRQTHKMATCQHRSRLVSAVTIGPA